MELVKVEYPRSGVCTMTLSATAAELEAGAEAVYERTRAEYVIPGFEKGAADRAEIEAARGEHVFWYDAINDIMDRDTPALYEKAISENKLVPVDEPSYDLVSVKKDEGFVATATVALEPELEIDQYTGFTVKCTPNPVEEKEVDRYIENRRQASAELVAHKGPAVKGNIVHLDYTGSIDGVEFKGGSAKNQQLELGSNRMIPGFEAGILGHAAGEQFDITVTFPANYHAKDLAGKEAVFHINLIDTCVRQIPALNADFAKKIGKVDTMEAFRADVRRQLEDMKKQNAMNRARTMLLSQLGEHAKGEVCDILVNQQYNAEMQQLMSTLQMQRVSMDFFLKQVGKTKEEMAADMRKGAENQMRVRMGLLKVARMENMFPTDAELDTEIKLRAERVKKPVEEYAPTVDRRALAQNLARQRASQFILDHSTIEE